MTGVDLSPAFIDAATYLTARCGLSDRVTFRVGDALHPPFEDATFDTVFLQHVAMNIDDRVALYAEVRRILTPDGRFATYDPVLRDGDVMYPAPWAHDTSTSFLLSEGDMRTALEQAGLKVILWRDDTQTALDWFKSALASAPPSGPNLGVVMGPDFAAKTINLARNIRLSSHGSSIFGARPISSTLSTRPIHAGLLAGQLGATYFIPTVLVPLLLITHGLAFRILLQHQDKSAKRENRPERSAAQLRPNL